MTEILLVLFACTLIYMMLGLSINRSNLVQYPFLAAAVMAGWVFPQFINLLILDDLPAGALERVILFSWLSTVAIWYAYKLEKGELQLFQSWQFSRRRLLLSAIVLSLLGHYFWYKAGTLSASVAELGGALTGPITIYIFLGEMLVVGLAISIVLHVQKASYLTMIIIVLNLSHVFERAFYGARREDMMLIVIVAALATWWRYRWAPSRAGTFALLIGGVLVVNTVGALRGAQSAASEGTRFGARVTAVTKVDFIDIFKGSFGDPYFGQEIREAAMMMEASHRYLEFDYGLYLWDRFVHRYVPGQIIGKDLKQALQLERENALEKRLQYIQLSKGITHTGMGDAFRSFWFFGVFVFYLIGKTMARWWRAADSGNPVARMVVLLITVKALLAITHTTPHFYLQFVTLSLFLLPFLYYSRVNKINL